MDLVNFAHHVFSLKSYPHTRKQIKRNLPKLPFETNIYIYFIEFLLQNYDIAITSLILYIKGIYIFLDFLYLRILKLKFKYNNVNKLHCGESVCEATTIKSEART